MCATDLSILKALGKPAESIPSSVSCVDRCVCVVVVIGGAWLLPFCSCCSLWSLSLCFGSDGRLYTVQASVQVCRVPVLLILWLFFITSSISKCFRGCFFLLHVFFSFLSHMHLHTYIERILLFCPASIIDRFPTNRHRSSSKRPSPSSSSSPPFRSAHQAWRISPGEQRWRGGEYPPSPDVVMAKRKEVEDGS